MPRIHAANHLRMRTSRSVLTIALAAAGLSGCGGGGESSSATQDNSPTAPTGATLSPQFVPVVSGLVKESGWVASPPVVTNSNATTPKTGRVFYVETLWGASNQSTAGRDGTSEDKAWLNLSDFAKKTDFQNGDKILLRCGSVWREQLKIIASGTSDPAKGTFVNASLGNGVTIGVYATPTQPCNEGNLPVIRASDYVSPQSWSPATIEDRPVLQTTVTAASRLFRKSIPETWARYPNETATQRYAKAIAVEQLGGESESAWNARKFKQFKVTEDVRLALYGREVKNSLVYIRTTPFEILRSTVSDYNQDTGVVTLIVNLFTGNKSDNKYVQVPTGAGYFLAGKTWMIDQPGEWASVNKTLYYQPRETTPQDMELTQSRDYGIRIEGINNLTIERISFEHQTASALSIVGSSNVTVSGVHIAYSQETGIEIAKLGTTVSNNVSVIKSRIIGPGRHGITAAANNHPGKVQFNDNYVAEAGTSLAYWNSTAGAVGFGIRLSGPNSEAKNNYVINSGGPGIWFSGDAPGLVVEGNTVINACRRLADCGGIYTFPDLTQTTATSIAKPTATEVPKYIRNNQVMGVMGDMEGLADGTFRSTNVPGRFLAHGIYLDSHSRNVEIVNNQVTGSQVGIYLHNAAWNKVQGNQVKSAVHASLLVSDDATTQPPPKGLIRGNRVQGNTWFSHRRVDPTAFGAGSQAIGSIRGGVDQVYAQFWAHPIDPKQMFEDNTAGDRNVSENNQTITLSKVESPAIWRINETGGLVQSSGSIWGTKAGSALHAELSENQWLSLVSTTSGNTPDSESSPVSYRPYATTLGAEGNSLIADFLLPQTPKTWFPNFSTGGSFSIQAGLPECGAAPSCGVLTGSEGWHIVASKPFSLTQNTMYLVQYNITAGGSGAWSDALVRPDAAPWTAVASVQPFQLGGNEKRRIEHFFRAPANASNMVLSLRPSDRTNATAGKTIYLNKASVHAVSSVQVLDSLETFSVTLVNASQAAKSFTCNDSGLSNCTSVKDELGQDVTFPVEVGTRSMKRLYVTSPTWSN